MATHEEDGSPLAPAAKKTSHEQPGPAYFWVKILALDKSVIKSLFISKGLQS